MTVYKVPENLKETSLKDRLLSRKPSLTSHGLPILNPSAWMAVLQA